MREVDQALSRAFALKATPADPPSAPHRPTRAATSRPSRVFRPATSETSPPPLVWPEVVAVLESEWGDRFVQLGDRVLEAREKAGVRVLLFTSCHRAEGRSTLVLTLARALARRPSRTLVVDADLNGPMLARSLGLRPTVGLDDVVERGANLDDAIVESAADNLWILPMRSAVARPRDFLAAAEWTCAMARLRREFDMILVDGSPLFAGLSAAVLRNSVDAAVLVHNRDVTGGRSIERAREVLEGAGVPLLGLAETFA